MDDEGRGSVEAGGATFGPQNSIDKKESPGSIKIAAPRQEGEGRGRYIARERNPKEEKSGKMNSWAQSFFPAKRGASETPLSKPNCRKEKRGKRVRRVGANGMRR